MIHKTTVLRTVFSFSAFILVFLFVSGPLQAQETSSRGPLTLKFNLLSPVWKNISGEVEYKIGPRLAVLAGVGVNRAFESLPENTGWECTNSRGFGLAVGTKYFLFIRESGKRSVDGIALKTTLNYTFDDEYEQTCPSLLPLELHRTHSFGLNAFVTAQKTFFDRLVVEAQAGVGLAVNRLIVNNSEILALYRNRTRFSMHFPIAVNVGWAL
jgi:hypothetical protein